MHMSSASGKGHHAQPRDKMAEKDGTETYKVVSCEWNMIQEIHLQFFSNQRGSIGVPI